jgi:hypothetical protein
LVGDEFLAGWTSGAIGRFETVPSVEKRLKDFKWVRKETDLRTEKEFKLTSLIRLDERTITFRKGVLVLSGIVIEEYISRPRRIEQNKEGVYRVVDGDPYVDTDFGKFWVTTRSIAVAQSSETRTFTFTVLSQALGTETRAVKFDVGKIAQDYDEHWLGSFQDRRGRMQSGTIYGDSVEQEALIRREYPRWKKNQVGFVTRHFGPPVKVKVTRDGVVVVYRDLYNDMSQYLRFVTEELLQYVSA